MSEVETRDERSRPSIGYREMEESDRALPHRAPRVRGAADDQLRARTTPPRTGCCGCWPRSRREIVRDIKPIIGYVHTGIEKTAEDKAYWKAIPVVERMDYLAYYFNAMAFCGAVETILDLEVPPRAQYLRVIHMELNRIMSHLVWLGTTALDLGAISMFWYCFRDREQILDLFEMSSGQRMHTRYFQVGGVFEDIPVGWEQKVRAFADADARPRRPVPRAADEERDRAAAAARRRAARRGDAARPRRHRAAAARGGQPVGPAQGRALLAPTRTSTSRSRSAPPATTGTAWSCASMEMKESVRIIEQALDGLPEGPYITRRPQVRAAAAPRAGDEHGGADPPLQARHGGLPRAAGRDLLPDRVAARGDGLLRARRRLLQARARAHARPLVREPAGLPADGAATSTSPTSSPRSACSTRCSAGSTADHGDRPDPRPPLRARQPRPRLGRRRRPDEGAGGRARRRRRRRCPTSCAPRSRTT